MPWAWLTRQFEDRQVEPNSALGGAISYMLKHWEKLTLFLRVPGAPLDNNARRHHTAIRPHPLTPYVVGWMLARRESEHLAERLIRETVLKEGIVRDRLTIHSDRGPSMRSQTVAQLLATLGISKSHSRPHVSNDNPFSESQFKTLKYQPEFPERFGSFEHAHDFCGQFIQWQNHEHHHWGLGLLTPAVVHSGQAEAVLAARQAVLDAAHAAHPERFVLRPPWPLALPDEVWINPPTDRPEPRMLQLPRDTNFKQQLSQTG